MKLIRFLAALLISCEFVAAQPAGQVSQIIAGTNITISPANGQGRVTINASGGGGGSGTVTSVAMSVPSFLSIGGSPITTSGTLELTLSGTALPYSNGGTGATSLTNHGVVVAGASALSTVAPSTSGNVLTSNGTDWTSAANTGGVSSITGTANQVIASAATGAVTLSTPQDIGTASTPQFGPIGIGVAAATTAGVTIANYPTTSQGGGVGRHGVNVTTSVPSALTSAFNSFTSQPSTSAGSFTLATLRNFMAYPGSLGASSTITNVEGFRFVAGLNGSSTTRAFYSDLGSGTGTYNLYMSGDAPNLLVGATEIRGILQIGQTGALGSIAFSQDGGSLYTSLKNPTGLNSTYQVTLPNAASTLPIFGQQVTFTGPSTARSYALPDANATLARTDAANTFTGASTTTSWVDTTPVITGGLTASGSGANTFAGSTGTFLTSTGAVTIGPGAVGMTGITTFTPPVRTSGVASYLTLTPPADTGQTASTESIGVNFATATRTWADGTVSLQRERFFAGPTYNKTTTSATFTDVFNLYLTPPVNGTGVTFTRGHTLGIVDSTSAASAVTGGLVVATTLGTAATSVGIGGGNINAGTNITAGGNVIATSNFVVGNTNISSGAFAISGTSTPTFTSSSTSSGAELQITGSGATDGGLRLRSTSGVGTSDFMVFGLGSNGAAGGFKLNNVSGVIGMNLDGNTNLKIPVGRLLQIVSGTNQRAGNATLTGGTVTVNNTTVTANTIVLYSPKTAGGTLGTYTYTTTAATSFTITSLNALDTSTLSYFLIEVP